MYDKFRGAAGKGSQPSSEDVSFALERLAEASDHVIAKIVRNNALFAECFCSRFRGEDEPLPPIEYQESELSDSFLTLIKSDNQIFWSVVTNEYAALRADILSRRIPFLMEEIAKNPDLPELLEQEFERISALQTQSFVNRYDPNKS